MIAPSIGHRLLSLERYEYVINLIIDSLPVDLTLPCCYVTRTVFKERVRSNVIGAFKELEKVVPVGISDPPGMGSHWASLEFV